MGQFHRHHRRGKRLAYWLILAVAAGICAWTVGDFAYRGILISGCSQVNFDSDSATFLHQQPMPSDDCRLVISQSELHQRLDAATALLGFAMLAASAVLLSKARHRTKRKLLTLECGVVVLVVAYTFTMTIATR